MHSGETPELCTRFLTDARWSAQEVNERRLQVMNQCRQTKIPKGKKPEIAIDLIDLSLARGDKPGIVLVDSGYGNNTNFLSKLETRNLKYLGGIAKNRKIKLEINGNYQQSIRVDELAASLSPEEFTEVQLMIEQPKALWVAIVEGEISRLEGKRRIA